MCVRECTSGMRCVVMGTCWVTDVLGLRSTWRLMHSIVLVSNYLLESAHHSIELENQLAKFIGLA